MNKFRFEAFAEVQHKNDASNVVTVLKRCTDADNQDMLYIIDGASGIEFVKKDVLESYYIVEGAK